MANEKILVIEDIYYLRNDVVEMLQFEGYKVHGAENGKIGLEMAREIHPDLIICDIMMPELNGYQVFESLRTDEDRSLAGIPFIFLTAKTDRIDIRKGMGLGADDYLTKPFLSGELLQTVEARLNNKKIQNDLFEERLNFLRQNIATALPHELRTPLNTIIGFSDMLSIEAGNLKPDQIAEWAGHINSASLRLYRLIENYLAYVRLEAIISDDNRRAVAHEHVTKNVQTVIQYQADYLAQKAHRESDLVTHINAPVAAKILENDLTKIIDELLDNAFKFSADGTPVTLDVFTEGDTLHIQVTDAGRGMDENHFEEIGAYMQFDRIFHEQQGAGLGLVIVKRITDLYKGTLSLESELDKGTVVRVTLNVAE